MSDQIIGKSIQIAVKSETPCRCGESCEFLDITGKYCELWDDDLAHPVVTVNGGMYRSNDFTRLLICLDIFGGQND
jgi:hypothetical protein